tara:strand:+ start:106 stop:345 length:240 start_codon:yes stop_codon:yes gene_type:complete
MWAKTAKNMGPAQSEYSSTACNEEKESSRGGIGASKKKEKQEHRNNLDAAIAAKARESSGQDSAEHFEWCIDKPPGVTR